MTPLRSILLSPAFTPARLFRAGEQGVWYDPSDFSTLFQDSAGTTPVTAVTQPVGKMLDKSGRGNHATQATAGSRPTLQIDSTGRYFLLADGTDDGMATGAIDFTGTDKVTLWAGVTKLSDAGSGMLVELSANLNSNNGAFYLIAPVAATHDYGVAMKGTTAVGITSAASFTAPVTSVLAGTGDVAAASTVLRVNGAFSNSSASTLGTGNFGNYQLFLFRRGGTTLPFNGRCYGLVVRGAATTDTVINRAERWMANKTGVAL